MRSGLATQLHTNTTPCILGTILYKNYHCLMASNKQQFQWTRIQRNPHKNWIAGNSQAGADSSKHEVVIAKGGVLKDVLGLEDTF